MYHSAGFAKSFSLLAALALGGCASMAPATALHMARFDPLEADPQQISVAIALPDSLLLRDGDIVMDIKQRAASLASSIDYNFKLSVIDVGTQTTDGVPLSKGQRLQLARVSLRDAARLRNLQTIIKEQQKGRGGHGSITVGIQGGCRTRDFGSESLKTSIFIKTDAASRYYPLMTDTDLRKQFGDAVINKIPPCST